jgi:hypothetical protein
MNVIKGFIGIAEYIDNTPGQIAPLGELSSWSRTYSKEKGEYLYHTVPGFKLITFLAVDESTSAQITVPQSEVRQILELAQACHSYAASHTRPYDTQDFIDTINVQFFGLITDLQFGDYVDNGQLALPEWISWTSLEHNGDTIKVWLADASFQEQYDEYSITVIPPLVNLDDFFNSYATVVNALDARSVTDLGNDIQAAKQVNPETYLRIMSFDFYNRLNTTQKHPSTWAVLIYGIAGDNIDTIKDEIVNYVLSNSTHTQNEWELILPDLFKRTEFVLLPRWDLVSIPNLSALSSLYSSVVNPFETVTFAQDAIEFYSDNHIANNLNLLPYAYKSIMIECVNGMNNVIGKQNFSELFPDYIPVPSTSLDFNRMDVYTRQWSLKIGEMLIIAETMNEFTSVPSEFRKIKRNGLLFLSYVYDNVNYLVAARSNSIYA